MVKQAAEEWDDLATESPTKMQFTDIGDVFIGTFEGISHITPSNGDDPFDLLLFRNSENGELCSTSGYKLMQAFADVPVGTLARIEYLKDVDTGRGNPMKDFKIQVKR